LGVTSHWVFVPTIRQSENECGARCFIHTYMMHVSLTPHLSLLALFKILKVKKLNIQGRKWVNELITKKEFTVPDNFKLLVDNLLLETTNTKYDRTWAEANSCSCTLNKDQYAQLMRDVRVEDVVSKHGIPKLSEDQAPSNVDSGRSTLNVSDVAVPRHADCVNTLEESGGELPSDINCGSTLKESKVEAPCHVDCGNTLKKSEGEPPSHAERGSTSKDELPSHVEEFAQLTIENELYGKITAKMHPRGRDVIEEKDLSDVNIERPLVVYPFSADVCTIENVAKKLPTCDFNTNFSTCMTSCASRM